MKTETAKSIVEALLEELASRGGFGVIDEIQGDEEVYSDLLESCTAVVLKVQKGAENSK